VRTMSTPTLSLERSGRVVDLDRAAVGGIGHVGDLLETIRAAPWVVAHRRPVNWLSFVQSPIREPGEPMLSKVNEAK
jgi:hypothetical protein